MAANINDTAAAAFVYSYLQEKDPNYAEAFKKKTNAVRYNLFLFHTWVKYPEPRGRAHGVLARHEILLLFLASLMT